MVVGFERTLYTVAESDGPVEVCAIVTNPPMSEPLPSAFTLAANTAGATAGMYNYTHMHTS